MGITVPQSKPCDQEFFLPVRCDGGSAWHNKQVPLKTCALLVCQPNDASAILRMDIEAAHTTYILIDGLVYGVKNVPRDIASQMQARGIHGDTFVIFSFRQAASAACTVSLVPFMGTLSRQSAGDMLKTLTFGSSEKGTQPVQVLAYRS